MKRFLTPFLLVVLPLVIVGCGGGGGDLAPGFDASAYSFTAFTPANTPSLGNADVRAVLPIDTNTIRRLYVGTAAGLYAADPTQSTLTFTKVTDAGLPTDALSQSINTLLYTKAGEVWIGTDGGLFTMNLTTGVVTAVNRLKGEMVTALAQQKSDLYWVGLATTTASTTALASTTNGIDFSFYGKDQGMTASRVVMIHATEDPALVVVCGQGQTGKGGLFKFNVSLNSFSVMDAPLTNGATLFTALGTTYYAGGPGSGLLYQAERDGAWKTLIADITPYAFNAVSYGSGYRTWIGANDGLRLTFDLATFKAFTTANGLASTTCTTVRQSTLGTFIGHGGGTDGGLSRADLVGG